MSEKYALPPHTGEVMYLFGFPDGADASSDLRFWWRTDHQPMTLYANCSDLFHWATSDLEPIEEADMPLLRECFEALKAVDETMWLGELFAARKRGMRPQGPFFTRSLAVVGGPDPDPVRELFLACGPERDDSPIRNG